MRIVTLLVRHGTTRYPSIVDDIDGWFAQHLPGVERALVVVDNALPEDYEERFDAGRVLIGSSNSDWEFSAWDRAVAYLGNQLHDFDLIHLATSACRALESKHLDYLDRFGPGILASVLGRGVAVGNIDRLHEPMVFLGCSSQAWLRSSWIFLPPQELRLLGSLVSISDRAAFFSGNADAPFRVGAPLSEQYQSFIIHWLTGIGSEWHSRFDLTTATLDYFERKTLAILNEHMLSVRLRAQGCAMVDATWLSTQHARLRPGSSLGAIPDWSWQIDARNAVLRHEHSLPRHDTPGKYARRATRSVRAMLVLSESAAIGRSHGSSAARSLLWRAVREDPWLLLNRPVFGALRKRTLSTPARSPE